MNVSKVNKEATGLEVANSRGGIGDLMLMFELRKKIITFRDILHLPPCANATAIAEVLCLNAAKSVRFTIWTLT